MIEMLLPERAALPADAGEARLSELYHHPTPWLRANMISTLDGAATGRDHRTGSINSPADNRVFAILRALADVILVGAGTVRAEGYRAPRTPEPLLAGRRARGQQDHPALAVVTRSGELPADLVAGQPMVFTTDDGARRLSGSLPPERLLVHPGVVDLRRAVATLVEGGLGRVLTEGGPHLLAELLTADLVDELCLTWSPTLVGGDTLRVVATRDWLVPRDARLAVLLRDQDVLLGRWLLR